MSMVADPAPDPRTRSRWQRFLALEVTPEKVKPVNLMNFCRYMSVFLTAGVPILDALKIIQDDTPDKKLRTALGEISSALRAGDSLSVAVAAHSRAFPRYFVNIVRAAEETGQMAAVLGEMSGYIERDVEARRKLRGALAYPAIVILLSLVSVGILVGFVLPKFVSFFAEFDARLPLPTRILVDISDFVVGSGLTVVLVVVAVILLGGAGTIAGRGRVLRDAALLRIPLISKVLRFAIVERFCRVLASMVQAGVPLPIALDLAASGGGNRAFGAKIAVARQQMIEGAGLSGPLAATGMFPAAAVQMLRVGEETGTLEERLEEMATFYGKEVEYRLKRITDMLEPAAVIVVGILVGFVALAMVSAIYGVFRGAKLS